MPYERLLKPRSIAAFGGANAQEVIRQSDRMGYKGEIWPVHPKKTEILGRRVDHYLGRDEEVAWRKVREIREGVQRYTQAQHGIIIEDFDSYISF